MKKHNPLISIIIVHYHASTVLINCIESIIKSKPKTPYEIIVVDNDEVKTLDKKLNRLYPHVKYLKTKGNHGFGYAVNLGVDIATGEYIALLNPDTIILNDAVDTLYKFTSTKKDVGIVAALIKNENNEVQDKQGAKRLTPLNAILNHSIISTLINKTFLKDRYWIYANKINNFIKSPSIPLGFAMIKKSIFKKVGSFDERFFLYYEDVDLCNRVEDAGYRNYIFAGASFIHLGGKGGTSYVKNLSDVYKKSGYLYFEKYYGKIKAVVTMFILNIGKDLISLFSILLLSVFLLFLNLNTLMSFFGDQAWYYLSARDMLLNGNFPLVGIPSSHPWLHQGAFWTYILAPIFLVTNFNLLAPGYFTAAIGVITVFLMYFVGKDMFSKNVGLIAAFLYATSPLIIIHARIPYHTSLIPITTLAFIYILHKWLKGNIQFFPWTIFLLAVLYNFQISTSPLTAVIIVFLVFGFLRKKKYVLNIINKKIIGLSFLAWLIPMLPMLLYDFQNGFPQTLKFVAWIGYRILKLFGFPSIHGDTVFEPLAPFIPFTITKIQQLIFLPNAEISLFIFLATFLVITYKIYTSIKKDKEHIALNTLYICFTLSFIFYLGIKTSSEAYWPLFFPMIILLIAVALSSAIYRYKLILISITLIIGLTNSYTLINNNYLMQFENYGYSYEERNKAAQSVVNKAKGREYNIQGKGEGSKYESFTMPYQYIAWKLGNEPTKSKRKVIFIINETKNSILIEEAIKK